MKVFKIIVQKVALPVDARTAQPWMIRDGGVVLSINYRATVWDGRKPGRAKRIDMPLTETVYQSLLSVMDSLARGII